MTHINTPFIELDPSTLHTVTGGVRPAPDASGSRGSRTGKIISGCMMVLSCIVGPQTPAGPPDPVEIGTEDTRPERKPGILGPLKPGTGIATN